MRRIFCQAAGLLVLLTATTAPADVASRTRFWDEKARLAYQQGQFETALSYFLWVYEQTPSAASAYNVALAAQQAKRTDLEFAFIQEYLSQKDSDQVRQAQVQARLEKLRHTLALLRVETTPPGARIVLDREELGDYGISPRTIVVSPSEHTVILQLEGYEAARVEFSAEIGKELRVTQSLSPLLGAVEVTASGLSGMVSFERDGHPVHRVASGQKVQLPVGTYQVRFLAPGYHPQETRILVRHNQTEQVTFAPPPLAPKQGRLLISSGTREANVYVDGKVFGNTPLSALVPVGRRRIELRSTRCRTFTSSIDIVETETAYVNAQLVCEAP